MMHCIMKNTYGEVPSCALVEHHDEHNDKNDGNDTTETSSDHCISSVETQWVKLKIPRAGGSILVGQVEDCCTMAAIHQRDQSDTRRHGRNKCCEQIIVTDLPRAGIVHRHQCFIISIFLFTVVVIANSSSVSCR